MSAPGSLRNVALVPANVTGAVPVGSYLSALDGPKVVRPGTRATVVATSYMVLEALRAAAALENVDCPIEVIDLRVVRPLDLAPCS